MEIFNIELPALKELRQPDDLEKREIKQIEGKLQYCKAYIAQTERDKDAIKLLINEADSTKVMGYSFRYHIKASSVEGSTVNDTLSIMTDKKYKFIPVDSYIENIKKQYVPKSKINLSEYRMLLYFDRSFEKELDEATPKVF